MTAFSSHVSSDQAYVAIAVAIFAVVSFNFLFPCNPLVPLDRRTSAVVGALACYLLGTFIFPSRRIDLLHAIDFDVLVLLASIMVVNHLVIHLRETKKLIHSFQTLLRRNPMRGFWTLSFVAFVVSPFLTNDGVCLLLVEPLLATFDPSDESDVTASANRGELDGTHVLHLPKSEDLVAHFAYIDGKQHIRTTSSVKVPLEIESEEDLQLRKDSKEHGLTASSAISEFSLAPSAVNIDSNTSNEIESVKTTVQQVAPTSVSQPSNTSTTTGCKGTAGTSSSDASALPLTRDDAFYFLIALACSTNIGSALTYTGNPQNMIVASDAINVMPPYKFIAYMILPSLVAWLLTLKYVEICWKRARHAHCELVEARQALLRGRSADNIMHEHREIEDTNLVEEDHHLGDERAHQQGRSDSKSCNESGVSPSTRNRHQNDRRQPGRRSRNRNRHHNRGEHEEVKHRSHNNTEGEEGEERVHQHRHHRNSSLTRGANAVVHSRGSSYSEDVLPRRNYSQQQSEHAPNQIPSSPILQTTVTAPSLLNPCHCLSLQDGTMGSKPLPSISSPLSPRRRRARAQEQMVQNVVRVVSSPLPYIVLVLLFIMIVMIFVDVMPISALICIAAIVMVLTVVLGNHCCRSGVVWESDHDPTLQPRNSRPQSGSFISSPGSTSVQYMAADIEEGKDSREPLQRPNSPLQQQIIEATDLGPMTREDKLDSLNDFFEELFQSIDYSLLFIFLGTFIVVENMASTGIPRKIWKSIVGKVPFGSFASIASISVFILIASQLLGNVAVVQLAKPNVQDLDDSAKRMAWAVISFVSTVGGNLTITGSAANIIVAEKANRLDSTIGVDFFRHFKVCFLVTLLACATGAAILYLVVSLDNFLEGR